MTLITNRIRRRDAAFLRYLIFFVAAWTGYVLLVYQHVQMLGEGTLAYCAAGISVRLLIWVLPVFAYLRAVDHVRPIAYLKLTSDWQRGIVVGMALAALIFAGNVVRLGPPQWAADQVTWNSILSTSLGIGFFEEIPFRGFLLQQFAERMNFWLANLLTSVVFLGMHLPGWLSLHLFTPGAAANVFILSIVWGAVFRYSRSLWSCIIAHSANDFFAGLLFHGR